MWWSHNLSLFRNNQPHFLKFGLENYYLSYLRVLNIPPPGDHKRTARYMMNHYMIEENVVLRKELRLRSNFSFGSNTDVIYYISIGPDIGQTAPIHIIDPYLIS